MIALDCTFRLVLEPRHEKRLLDAVAGCRRTTAIYLLSLRAGLDLRQIVACNVADVLPDGKLRVRPARAPEGARAATPEEPMEVRLSARAAGAVRSLAAERLACPHWRRPMRTLVDGAVERCISCFDIVDAAKAPLFVTLRHNRVTSTVLHRQFAKLRRLLRLPAGLHLSSLRDTYLARRAARAAREAGKARS